MPGHESAAVLSPAVEFGGVTPILRVASLDASLAWYVDVLGFAVQWRETGFASVGRGRASLMLCEGGQGHPGTWAYVGVSDADALHEELRARGAAIRHPPTNYPWGAREMQVSDPDGHVLRFGSDAVPGEPVGEWLDGEGVRWVPQPDGSWRAAE
ncbi:MAG TPA: glyoxalase superfamily protein [Longimicrobiaceae bacterium]